MTKMKAGGSCSFRCCTRRWMCTSLVLVVFLVLIGPGYPFTSPLSRPVLALKKQLSDCNKRKEYSPSSTVLNYASSGQVVNTAAYKSEDAAAATAAATAPSSGGKRSGLYSLSVTELKRLLSERGIDFRDCIEKRELVERLENHSPAAASSSGTG